MFKIEKTTTNSYILRKNSQRLPIICEDLNDLINVMIGNKLKEDIHNNLNKQQIISINITVDLNPPEMPTIKN